MDTQLAIYDSTGASFGTVRAGLQGNYDIVVRMASLVRNSSFFDKGFEKFTKQLIKAGGFDSYSNAPELFEFLYNYVHRNISYVRDAAGNVEQLKTARQTLSDGFGDCDDQSVLIASMLAVLGFEPVFVLARYAATAESYSHIYTALYKDNERFVFDTTLPDGKLNSEIKTVAIKEIPVFGFIGELDGANGFIKQSLRLVKDIAKGGIQATPNLLGSLPLPFGFAVSQALNAGASLMGAGFAGDLTYSELASAINRQLDAILLRLHKGEITLDEAKTYARMQAARFTAENLDGRQLAKQTINNKAAIDASVKAKLEAIVNFDSYALANDIATFNFDANKTLIVGAGIAVAGIIYFLKKG